MVWYRTSRVKADMSVPQGFLSLLYLASSDMYALINYVGFATWLSIGMAIVSLLYLRRSQPNLPRPIKVHLAWPIIYTIVTIYLVILPLYASPTETGEVDSQEGDGRRGVGGEGWGCEVVVVGVVCMRERERV